jgi:hypothetical protein
MTMETVENSPFRLGLMFATIATLIGGCPYVGDTERLPETAGRSDFSADAAPLLYRLAITVDGQGTVSPNGVFEEGSAVTILAAPAPGWKFLCWSGDVPQQDTATNPLTIGVDQDLFITAVFTALHKLEVHVRGRGSVTPPGGLFDEDETVTLAAVSEPGFTFVRWEGAVSGNDNPVTVVMHADASVTAVFAAQRTLTVHVEGLGRVAPCSGTFLQGAEVELVAEPGRGWDFAEWSGDVPAGHATDNPLTVTMDGDVDITVTFGRGILPGVAIGPIALGDTATDVDQALGIFLWSPDPAGPGIRFAYPELGIVGILADLDGDRRPGAFEPVILVGAMAPFAGTLDGTGIGSPETEVVDVMGPAERIDGNDLWYPSCGVVWTIENGIVIQVAVVRPFAPDGPNAQV